MDKDSKKILNELLGDLLSKLSHDLVGQLAVLRLKNGQIKKILPYLTQCEEIKHISRDDINELVDSDYQIEEMLRILTFILEFIKTPILDSKEKDSIITKIQKVIASNNFNQHQISVFVVDDFLSNINPKFIKHILDNILNYYPNNEINIWTEEKDKYGEVFCKIVSKNIEEVDGNKLLKDFLIKKEQIMPGMGLCRLALMLTGGDIMLYAPQLETNTVIIKIPLNAGFS